MDKQFDQNRDNLHKRAWQMLNVLKTPAGAKYRIQKQFPSQSHLAERAEALSTLLNTAYQYYQNYLLAESIINLYYMSFKIIQCFIIVESPHIYSLSTLQESSKYGHGIKMELYGGHFPKRVFFHYSDIGMFNDYLKMKGWNGMGIKKIIKRVFQN